MCAEIPVLMNMNSTDIIEQLTNTIDELSTEQSMKGIFHEHRDGDPLPSGHDLEEIIELSRSVLFPGYYGNSNIKQSTVEYHIGVNMERLHKLLTKQIMAGLLFNQDCHCAHPIEEQEHCRKNAEVIALTVLSRYPEIRRMLSKDVEAAYEGDPAAINEGEVICCYPVIKALTNYRIAHELYREEVPLIPRMMTELAHSETGIDIHPAATIGKHFTIDHGTGVVIGATCIIGDNVKLYQGVTLGAKSFPLDENGKPIKGIPRHPIIGNNVIIYANSTILGRIHIGDGCVIGANVWVTKDMKAGTKKYRTARPDKLDVFFEQGGGI